VHRLSLCSPCMINCKVTVSNDIALWSNIRSKPNFNSPFQHSQLTVATNSQTELHPNRNPEQIIWIHAVFIYSSDNMHTVRK
jgi:hypothetical protein